MKLNPVFALFLLLLAGCGAKDDAVTAATYNYEKETEPVTFVDVLEATKSALIPVINGSGIVKGINETLILSETQGIIEEVYFTIGNTFAKGDALLKVDDTIALYNKDQVKLELETAKIESDAARKANKSGSLSLVEFKRAENRYYAQKVRYEQALKAWKDCTIRAPFSGIVAEKDSRITKGTYITPGTPVARIVDSSSFTVSISLGERLIGFVEIGGKADIKVPAAGDRLITGEVTAVAGGSDEQTGSFIAVISWKNNGGNRVKSGMSAQVHIKRDTEDSSIIVPYFSIVKKTDGDYVFIVEDNKASARKIRIGKSFGERVEVIEGISEGDLVIITRISTLITGDPVMGRVTGTSGEWE